MLVKVNERYKGVYGHFNRELNTVTAKRAGDPPFDVPAVVAERHIENGVLIAAEPYRPARTESKTNVQEAKVIRQAPVKEAKAVEKMSFPELKAAAKERGINIVGKKKTTIISLIKEYDQGTPELTAAEPV